jgi:hypothetical protein
MNCKNLSRGLYTNNYESIINPKSESTHRKDVCCHSKSKEDKGYFHHHVVNR